MTRRCRALTQQGRPCRQSPLIEADYCFWHSPEHAEEAADARRMGGLRRRREKTIAGAYEIEALDSVGAVRRVLEIALFDTLGLENSLGRSRALAYLAQIALRTLEAGEFEERLAALEAASGSRDLRSALDTDLDLEGSAA